MTATPTGSRATQEQEPSPGHASALPATRTSAADRQNDAVTDNDHDVQQARAEEFARIENLRARAEEFARIQDRAREQERARIENFAPSGDVLTEEERAQVEERAELEARDLSRRVAEYRRDVAGRTEEELVAEAPPNTQIRQPLELTRRLIDSNKHLQFELARSRESSERTAATLSGQMTELTSELVSFRTSSDTLAGRVLWWSRTLAGLTVVLLLGTIVLIWLTVVLVQRTGASPAGNTRPPAHTSSTSRPVSPTVRPRSAHSAA